SYPRRLQAEVILDAIDQVTGVPTKFNSSEATRAIELTDEAVPNTLLEVFGKTSRDSACRCERASSAPRTQSLFLIASRDVQGKLRQSSSRAAKWAADPRPDADKVKEMFLWVFSRPPTPAELRTAETFLTQEQARAGNQKGTKQEAYEDLLWAL